MAEVSIGDKRYKNIAYSLEADYNIYDNYDAERTRLVEDEITMWLHYAPDTYFTWAVKRAEWLPNMDDLVCEELWSVKRKMAEVNYVITHPTECIDLTDDDDGSVYSMRTMSSSDSGNILAADSDFDDNSSGHFNCDYTCSINYVNPFKKHCNESNWKNNNK